MCKGKNDSKMEKVKVKGLAKIAIFALLVVVLFAVGYLLFKPSKKNKLTTISASSLAEVIEINDFSTLDYTYNAIAAVYEEDGETLKYHVAYEGIVTAGIDINQIDIQDNEEKKQIVITLPEAECQMVSVDMGTMQFIFADDDYETETVSQEAYKACVDDLNRKANEEGRLLSMAKENAVAAINALISPWVEQLDQEYTVEVK